MRVTPVLAATVTAALLAACGSAPTATGPRPWRSGHPDPAGVVFSDAHDVCVITVRYPADAPGEIDYAGRAFVQRDRFDASLSNNGTVIGRSGDWTLYQQDAGTLRLATPQGVYLYRSGASCGGSPTPG